MRRDTADSIQDSLAWAFDMDSFASVEPPHEITCALCYVDVSRLNGYQITVCVQIGTMFVLCTKNPTIA